MSENVNPTPEVTSDDRLWAALSWLPVSPLYPLLAVLMLLMDEKKHRPFIRYNAVLSLATGAALIPLSIITLGFAALGYLLFFWWAYQAYKGVTVKLPFLSDLVQNQRWA